MDLVVSRSRELLAARGPGSIGFYTTGRLAAGPPWTSPRASARLRPPPARPRCWFASARPGRRGSETRRTDGRSKGSAHDRPAGGSRRCPVHSSPRRDAAARAEARRRTAGSSRPRRQARAPGRADRRERTEDKRVAARAEQYLPSSSPTTRSRSRHAKLVARALPPAARAGVARSRRARFDPRPGPGLPDRAARPGLPADRRRALRARQRQLRPHHPAAGARHLSARRDPLALSGQAADAAPARRNRVVTRAVREVSGYLGNTPAVCRAAVLKLLQAGHV